MLWGGGATAASMSAPTASTARTADSMRFDERLILSVNRYLSLFSVLLQQLLCSEQSTSKYRKMKENKEINQMKMTITCLRVHYYHTPYTIQIIISS